MGNALTVKRYMALVIGAILAAFSVGRFNIPLFIFIWPMLFLYYIRNTPSKIVGMFFIAIICFVVSWLKFQGFADQSLAWNMCWGLVYGCYQMAPFIIEAGVYEYIPDTYDILLFPFAEASIEFAFSFIPKPNINLFANAMQNNLLLIQCMSLFGTYFLSFFLALFNTVFYYGIKVFLKSGKITKWIFSYIAIFVFLEIYGAIYIQVLPDYTQKMKIAMIPGITNLENTKGLKDDQTSRSDFNAFENYMNNALTNTLGFGVDTLFVAEEGFDMFNKELPSFFEKITDIQGGIYKNYGKIINIVAGIEYSTDDEKNLYNELIVSPLGDDPSKFQPTIYTSRHPIPEVESGYRRGRKIETTHMYYGAAGNIAKVSSAISDDINFPHFMNWIAFKEHPDIVFVGSWDFDEISIFQSYVAAFRSIENGYSIVKNTAGGITVITDFCGRFLEYYKVKNEADDYLVVASVWGNGRKTLYSYIGIFWNFFYILGVFIVAVRGYFVKLEQNERRLILKTRSSNLPTENQRLETSH